MASAETTAKPVVNNVDKEKKPRSSKGLKPSPSHPTYLQMITEAITSLKESTGSSQYAIAAYIGNKYQSQLPDNFKKLLTVQLRNLARSGKLTKVKNSFKLSEELKKPVKPKAAKPKALVNKPVAKSKAAPGLKKVSRPAKAPAKVTEVLKVSTPKPAKAPAKVTEVLKVSTPKPATSTEKLEKAAAPVKKGATVKKEAPAKKLAVAKKPAKAVKRGALPKPEKAVPAAKKAKK
eukprot:PITA_06326